MAIQLQSVKGFRDLYPPDKALQNYVFEKLKEAASLYGFENYDGPILEPIELYLGKTSKELIERQTFQFKDKKGEILVMRPEMTPSLARMIAQKANELVFPLKLFNLGLRYRYEAPQKGRVREFYQGDFDILGTESILADAEILAVAVQIFIALGGNENDFKLYINSRSYMKEELIKLGIPENQIKNALDLIDKLDKMTAEEALQKYEEFGDLNADLLKKFLEEKTEPEDDPYFSQLFSILRSYGLEKYCEIDKGIVRGLDYYTGIVFEVKEIGELKRSLLGGGRYDNLVSTYNPNYKIPGVGFATSDVSLLEFIKDKNLVPQLNSKPTKYLVTVFSTETLDNSIEVLNKLRKQKIPAEIYPDASKKLDKQLKYADRNNIPFAIVIGPEEINRGVVKVKDMKSGEQKEIMIQNL